MYKDFDFSVKKFDQLTVRELYEIIKLRVDVFVVEQNCPYNELDGKDFKALHLLMNDKNNVLAGYLRILPEGLSYETPSLGRIVIAPNFRKNKLGRILVQKGIDFVVESFGKQKITIGAQAALENFYNELGFVKISEVYLEDGIPHMDMRFSHN
ncbi:GNAT family N-acetyltransferase [Aureibacter tunicatorum]|uniref:ElaA protein n=1 Tax=Aureibacter tunicatorum TaxID=866807 RepID=A0AAE3XT80_9BACT|nr:GNAT family N-acetyltransferase [Aureibacter tunicatorum]MDR6241575.1 ElaA protein [Aureibacter tunicatorum]